jgi:hypothetical protein
MQAKSSEIIPKSHHAIETKEGSPAEEIIADLKDGCSMQCSSELMEHSLYALIQEVDQVIRERFPYGAFNQVDVIASQEISFSELNMYFRTHRAYEVETDDESKRDIRKLADMTQSLVQYHCGMSTNYATGYLKNKYPEINIKSIFLKGHIMLLIGSEISSTVNIKMNRLRPEQIRREIDRWGPNAIICDIWAGKSYFARELMDEKQKSNIMFNTALMEHDQLKELLLAEGHYLDGDIDIYAEAPSQRYDGMLIQWVKEDQRRFHLPNCTTPRTPSFIATPVGSSRLLPVLSQLSKCDGWKYNAKQNVAWIECETPKQAERAAKSLEFTKAAVVRVGTNPANKKPLVRCEYFDFTQLKRLSDSLVIEQELVFSDISSVLRSMTFS